MNKSFKGFLLIVIATFLWATSSLLAKHIINLGITPLELVQARLTISTLVLLVFFRVFQPSYLKIDRKDILYFIVLGIFGIGMVQVTSFFAISEINVGVAITLQYLAPTMIVVYSVIVLKETILFKTIISVVLALIGCYLVIGAYEVSFSELNLKGILWGLSAALSMAFYTLYSKKGLSKYTSGTVLFYAFLFATVFSNLIESPFSLLKQEVSFSIWAMILALSIFGTLLAFLAYLAALKLLSPIKVNTMATLDPIFATLGGFLLLGERLSWIQIVGGLFIILSLLIITMRKKKPNHKIIKAIPN